MNAGTGTSAPHILILEDDTAHQDLILRAFRDDPDKFRLSVASTIRSAREILERDRPDLILSDWILPDGKGLDILPRTDGLVTIPLIIMTSFGDEHLAVEIMKSGAIDYVVKSATMFRDLPHIARRALSDWENILERKRAEAAVQDSRKRLADIIGFLPDAMLAIDTEGRVIAWNEAIERMTGIAAADMLGKGDHEYSIPFYGERRPILIDLALAEDTEIEKKYYSIQRDGERITVETFIPTIFGGRGAYLWGTATPLFDSGGNRIGAIEVIRDITERKQSEELLRRREITLETLLNAPHDTIALLDRQGIVLNINTEGARRLGGTVRGVTGKCVYDLLPLDVAKVRKARIDRVFETGDPVILEDEQSGVYLHNEIFPVFNPDHTSVDHVAVFARDITEQKKAELALQESERNLARAQEIGHVGSWEWDPGNKSLVWSEEMYRVFGVSRTFCLTFGNIVSCIHPDDRERNDRIVKELFAAGTGTEYEFRIVRPDGIERSVIQKIEVTRDGQGSPKKIFGIIQDITEQKEAETALIESEKKYRFLLENVRDIIWQTTPDLVLTYVSPAAELLTGYPVSDLIGTSLFDLLTESSAGIVRERLQDRFRDFSLGNRDLATVFEAELTKNDGISLWLEISSNAVFGPEGIVTGFQGISRDITERKRAEKVLQESETRFRDLFSNMSAGVAIYEATPGGEDFVIQDVNHAVETIEQVKKDEIIGRSVLEVFPGVVEFGLFSVFQRVARTGIAESHPVSMYHDNRISGWRENYVYKLPSGEIVALYEDVTKQKQAEEAERGSTRKYAELFELGSEAVFLIDNETGALLEANAAAGEMYGYSRDVLLTMKNTDLSAEEEETRKVTTATPPSSILVPLRYHRRKDGTVFPVEILGRFFTWNNRPVHIAAIRDITERKAAEEALRESRQILEGILNTIPVRVFWKNKELTYLGCNTAFAHDAGFEKPEDLIGKDDYSMGWREQAELYRADDRAVIESGKPKLMIEEPQTTPAGETITILTSKVPLLDARGDVIGVLGTYLDITNLKRAEQALREREIRFRGIFNAAFQFTGLIEPDGTLLEANKAAFDFCGITPDQVIGKPFWETCWWRGDEKRVNDLKTAISRAARGEFVRYEVELQGAGDTRGLFDFSLKPVVDGTGKVVLLIPEARDISERKRAEAALHESETRFRSLIQNSSDIIRILDREGRIVYESPSSERILGYPPGDMIGKDPLDYVHPEDLGRVTGDLREVHEKRNPGTPTEFRVRKSDGEYLWVDSLGANLLDTPGVNGIVVTTRPIQQRKEAEEQINKTIAQLERSEALLRKVYDILPIGLWLADKNGKLLYGNPAGVKIWGGEPLVPLEEYGVFKARRYPSEEEIAGDDWALSHTILEGVTIKDELLEIDAFDGKKKIIVNYTAPLYDAAGAIDGAIVVNQEITDKVKAEEALRENQARLATAMDIAGLVNWEFDVATGLFTFDDRFYSLYATTADQEGGNLMSAETYMQEFVYPDDRPSVRSAIQKLLVTTDPAYTDQMEHRITPRDGSVRTIIARFAPVMGPDGGVIRTVGANQDITDFKLMESEIRSLNTVLEQRVRDRTEALAKTNEALEEEVARRQEAEKKLRGSYDEKVLLLKEIHHRVKNNLQIIASLLNLQSRYIKDESTLAAIRESQNRVKAMALVHEKLYRSEDISHVSLHDYLRFLGSGLFQFYDARLRGIQFTLDIHDVNVDIDAAIPLGLILNEMISNSLKYAFPEGRTGEIAISVKKDDHTLTVVFRDTGIGIPAELDWRDTQSLGLRLVNTLVDQLNGTVELDRSSGTQFTMVLHEKEPREQP